VESNKFKQKLIDIQKKIKQPVKLSDVEKARFTEIFDSLKELIDDVLKRVMDMDRDSAYRYSNLLILALQKADIDFIAGVSAESPLKSRESVEVEQDVLAEPVVRPTKEQIDQWISELTPEAKAKIGELDCISQYLDPEGPGIEIICNHCSKAEMVQCIRNIDPSFTDAGSIFMRFQLEG